jgi:hypothetical protein
VRRNLTPAEAAALAEAENAPSPADPPPGPHDAVVTDARLDTSRSGHAMIACSLTAAGGVVLPALYLSLHPNARHLFEDALRGLGILLPPGGKVTVSARALVGRRLRVRVELDRDGALRSRVAA